MNARPHAHQVQLRRTHNYSYSDIPDSGGYFVRYGDQTQRYAWAWQRPERWSAERLERRVSRATTKAVRRHDRESVRAGEAQDRRNAAMRRAEEAARQATSKWAE